MEPTNKQLCIMEELFMQMFSPMMAYVSVVFSRSEGVPEETVLRTFRITWANVDGVEKSTARER